MARVGGQSPVLKAAALLPRPEGSLAHGHRPSRARHAGAATAATSSDQVAARSRGADAVKVNQVVGAGALTR